MRSLQITDHDAIDLAMCLKPGAPVSRFVLTGAITDAFREAVKAQAPTSPLFDALVEYVEQRVERENLDAPEDWPT